MQKKQTKTVVAPSFISGLRDELRRVSWPTRKHALYLTLVVLIISLIVSSYVSIIDILMAKILQFLSTL